MVADSSFALPEGGTAVAIHWIVLYKQIPEMLIGVFEFKANVCVIGELDTNHVTDNSRVQKGEHE